jgi:hypothetical protein
MDGSDKDAEIITYRIPRIEVYQVTDDELCRIEEECGKVSQDFAFSTSFLSFGIAFTIALLTAPFSEWLRTVFVILVIVCGVGCLYTGIRWWSQRRKVPEVVAKIRSRKTEPQAPTGMRPL